MSKTEIREIQLLISHYRDVRNYWETEFQARKDSNELFAMTFRGQVMLGCIEEINVEINGLRELLTESAQV